MKLLMFGDSHIGTFKYINAYKLMPEHSIDVCLQVGATAQGIANTNSESHTLNVFRKKLNSMSDGDYDWAGLMLGEVDCGFAIWYRAEQYNITIKEQLDFAIDKYTRFVKNEMEPKFGKNIIICGAHLPTLNNDKDNNDAIVRKRRLEAHASKRDRTDLTLKYNRMLKKWAVKNKYSYADITEYSLDPETKLIKDELCISGNHHIPPRLAGPIWVGELRKILK